MLFSLLDSRKTEFIGGWKDMLKSVENSLAGDGESLLCGAMVNIRYSDYIYQDVCQKEIIRLCYFGM